MSATQNPPRHKFLTPSLRRSHPLILNGDERLKRLEWCMPIFEYVCKECDHQFEALVYGNQKAECPKCQSKKLAQQLSVFAMSAKGSGGSSPAMGACGSCGDPRGPGACSMPELD
jgi:putative FmdB family regulatory protein